MIEQLEVEWAPELEDLMSPLTPDEFLSIAETISDDSAVPLEETAEGIVEMVRTGWLKPVRGGVVMTIPKEFQRTYEAR